MACTLSIAPYALDAMERPTRIVARPGRDAVGRNLRAFEKAGRCADLNRLAAIHVTGIQMISITK
jgi:hypothetical protein